MHENFNTGCKYVWIHLILSCFSSSSCSTSTSLASNLHYRRAAWWGSFLLPGVIRVIENLIIIRRAVSISLKNRPVDNVTELPLVGWMKCCWTELHCIERSGLQGFEIPTGPQHTLLVRMKYWVSKASTVSIITAFTRHQLSTDIFFSLLSIKMTLKYKMQLSEGSWDKILHSKSRTLCFSKEELFFWRFVSRSDRPKFRK